MQPAAIAIGTVASLVDVLRQGQLLTPPQLDELVQDIQGQFKQPKPLAQALLQRGWLTPFQLTQIFMGRGKQLAFGPYVLLERLGEGAVGYVFKARHQHMQRVVALKVIRRELLTDQEIVGRFYREIHAISQLVHPNIITAYDAGPAGKTHFFAMEFVEGIDLVKMTKEAGTLPADQASDYIRQAALGLHHIHERGQVHRDIKPSNLLVAHGASKNSTITQLVPPVGAAGVNRWGLLKVLDLGLARLAEPVNGVQNPLTIAGGGLRGTADYLAPEQAIDFHRADIRSDIYSLGCAFYFLLTGKPPFDGGTLAQKLIKHQREEPPALETVCKDVPRKLPPILARMIAKKPEDRYQQPAEVAEALESLFRRSWLSSLWR